jgi:hypothetical protein
MQNAKILVNNKEGIQYITIAESLRRDLDNYRKNYKLPFLAKTYHITKDVRIDILSSDINPYIHIYAQAEVEGFICHPRTGEFKLTQFNTNIQTEFGVLDTIEEHYIINSGGWDEKIKPITNIYHIPLVDGDGGSSILTKKQSDIFEETHGEYSYGNIYWTNGKKVISWKGPPGRHIPLPDHLQIPGLTTLDDIIEGISGDIKYYTPFSYNIYSKGKVLATAPEYNWSGLSIYPKVLGAAFQNNVLVLIAGVNKKNTEPSGFYDSVFITTNLKDWELIAEFPTTRHRLPYFFNSIGTSAVNRNRLINVDVLNKTATLTELENNSNVNATVSADFWNLNGASTTIVFREFKGTELVSLNTQAAFSESTTTQTNTEEVEVELPVYIEGELLCPTILGSDTPVVGTTYTLSNGTYCPSNVVWTFSGGTINQTTGTILSITGCGTATITATLENCTLSKTVRLPTGTWIFSHCEKLNVWAATHPDSPCSIAWNPFTPCYTRGTKIEGAIRSDYYFDCSGGTGVFGTLPCPTTGDYQLQHMSDALVAAGYENVAGFCDSGFTSSCPCYRQDLLPALRFVYTWECP